MVRAVSQQRLDGFFRWASVAQAESDLALLPPPPPPLPPPSVVVVVRFIYFSM